MKYIRLTMKKSKLTEILSSLSPGEFKSFEKMVFSPYFAVRDVKPLFLALKPHYPEFSAQNLEKAQIFNQVFPRQKYNEKKLKNLVTDLTRLAEELLISLSASSNESDSIRMIAGHYKERKKDKLFLRTLNVLESKLSKKLFSSIECFSEEEKTEYMKAGFYNSRNMFEKSVASKLIYSEYFTVSFIIRFLRLQRDKITITTAYNLAFENPLIDGVYESMDFEKLISILRRDNYPLLWLIEIYYYVFMSSQEIDNDGHYFLLKEKFLANIDKFSHTEKFFLFNDLIDCCVRKFNLGRREYEREEFDVYTQLFIHNAFSATEKDYLSLVFYRNVMLLALNLKEFEWLRKFIKEFSARLKPEYMENMMNLASANLCFEEGDFEQALQYISRVQYDIFLYKTDIKNLMLRIYYELGYFEQAFSLVDSYRHFLSDSTELSGMFKKQQMNFLNIYVKLLKAKADGAGSSVEFLQNEIKKQGQTALQNWLTRKIDEFSN